MPRGSNSSIETSRVSAQERFNSSRGNGKTDAGAAIPNSPYLKKGFGSEKGMQSNPKKMPAPRA